MQDSNALLQLLSELLGIEGRHCPSWLPGLVEKAIYHRKLGTPIQKCGFAEYAESVR